MLEALALACLVDLHLDSKWSRFRGPNGSGVADTRGLPADVAPKKNVIWMTELPPGHSSPVLFAERVYLTASEDDKLLTIALDRSTGAFVWRKEAPRDRVTKVHARNHHAAASPAVDADAIVVFFDNYGLVAYDHDGEERWRKPLGPFNNVYGMGASPILVGDRVVLACDQQVGSFLIALDKTSGEVLWRTERPEAKSGHCTPILYEPEEGGTQVILPGSFYLDAYDVATGERVWWVSGLSFEMKSVPVLHDGVVYINGYGSPMNQPGNQIEVADFDEVVAERDGDGDGKIKAEEMPPSRAAAWFGFVDLDGDKLLDAKEWAYLQAALASKNGMLAIRAGGKGDMTETNVLWTYHRSVPQLPSPLVYENVLYMLNDSGGVLTTFEPRSGEIIKKGRLEEAQDNYYASPVAADGKVYFVSESGIVTVVEPSGNFEPLAVNELDEPCYATPAIADGRIYLRTTGRLYCFGLQEKDER